MEGTPSICFGGRALFRKKFHLEENGFESHGDWLRSWRERRSSQFYAVGSGDEKRGNGECQFDPDQGVSGCVCPCPGGAVRDPPRRAGGLQPAFRPADALAQGWAISYRFLRRDNGSWYVQATTLRDPVPILTRRELGAIGADLNADHIAVAELDWFGNLAGHRGITLDGRGLSTEQAEARIGDAVASLVLQAKQAGKPLVIEALDFRRKKSALRELGKRAAGMLSSLVFAKFQEAAQSRCEREGVELIRVNPAYTSTLRPRSVSSGGASHPGRGSPRPVTVRSSGRYGVRTPAVLAVGTAAPETGQTKGPID